jgi:hypothetical protein
MSDRDNCPDAIKYVLSFDYTIHADGYDRFYDDVDKMVVYVFDAATGSCVYADTTTLLAPFEKDFTYTLPLNVGKYDIITWGWGRNTGSLELKRSSTIIPNIIPGTNIQNARFLLEKNLNDGRLEKNFYGELHDVEISAFTSREDTMRLMNLVNQIRIVFPDINTAELQDKVEINIKGYNGAYFFEGSPFYNSDKKVMYYAPNMDPIQGIVTTRPYKIYRTDSVLLADPIYLAGLPSGTGKDSMLVADISVLRLVQSDENMKAVINVNNYLIELPLLEILQSGFSSNVQYYLDKYDRWQLFINTNETYGTIHIYVADWHFVYQRAEAGPD